jgi:hypothetical protein
VKSGSTFTPGRLVGTLQDPINLELAPAPAPPADLNVEPDFTLTWTG